MPLAPEVPSTSDERVVAVGAVNRHHHAGRGLVVRVGVHVALDVIGELRTLARRRLAHLRVVEVRRGPGGRRELRRELADHEVRALALDETEHRGVPEERGPAVADQHLVAVGKREEVGHAPRGSARTTERTPSLRWLVPRNPGAASASAATASCGTFDGPEPKRPSRGRSAVGISIIGSAARGKRGTELTGSR